SDAKASFLFLPCRKKIYAVLAPVSKCYPPLIGRLPTCYSPVRHSSFNKPEGLKKEAFDLHVLGTPPAFVLSQDQTLIIKVCIDHTPDRFCSNKIDFASFCLHVFASINRSSLHIGCLLALFSFQRSTLSLQQLLHLIRQENNCQEKYLKVFLTYVTLLSAT